MRKGAVSCSTLPLLHPFNETKQEKEGLQKIGKHQFTQLVLFVIVPWLQRSPLHVSLPSLHLVGCIGRSFGSIPTQASILYGSLMWAMYSLHNLHASSFLIHAQPVHPKPSSCCSPLTSWVTSYQDCLNLVTVHSVHLPILASPNAESVICLLTPLLLDLP